MKADPATAGILGKYPHATPFQRWHMRQRLRLCPYDALVPHLTGTGPLLDVGCGFGHLAWYLAPLRPDLGYYGVDIDARKIALAAGSAPPGGGAGPAFRLGNVLEDALPSEWPVRFGNIVILDVLYLLPWEMQVRMLDWSMARLSDAPGSALVVKSMEKAEGMPGARALIEEWVMVHLLRRTRSSGTIRGAKPAEAYGGYAEAKGWRFEVDNLGTWNPSYLVRIHK